MHIFAYLLSNDLPLNSPFDDSAIPFGDVFHDKLRVALVSGIDFCPVRVDNHATGWSESTIAALRSMSIYAPHLIEWGQNDDLRKQVCDDSEIEQEKRALAAIKQQYQRLLWQYCSKRVVDLAMIFVDLPALIIVEICLFDRECLKVVEGSLWGVAKNVKKVKM